MSTATEDETPRALVRRFSAQVAALNEPQASSSNTLRNIIAEDYGRARLTVQPDHDWARHFKPWSPLTAVEQKEFILRPAAVKLSFAWSQFRDKVPSTDAAFWQQRAPDFHDVFDLMDKISGQFEENRDRGSTGFVGRYFRRSCYQLKSHENLLKILPEGNEYVSLFTGVLKSIICASRNHEKVLVAFAQSWAEISEEVSFVEDVREMYPTRKIQELTMNLYANIFSYLNNALDWYLAKPWKRAVRSFKEDLYEEFQEQISTICKIAQNIRNHASILGQGAQIHDLQLKIEDFQKQARRFDVEQERKRLQVPEMISISKTELAGLIASHFKSELEHVAVEAVSNATQRLQSFQDMAPAPDRTLISAGMITASTDKMAVLESADSLQHFFDKDRLRVSRAPSASTLPTDVASRLQHWVSDDDSAMLYIFGDDAYSDPRAPDSLSSVASNVIAFTEVARLPVISYFCSLAKAGDLSDRETRAAQALAALVYALIWQLAELLPSDLVTNIDLGSDRLAQLDGTTRTFPEALALLRDVVRLAPPVLYCILDGLHWLDDKSTRDLLDQFVSCLLAISNEHRAEDPQVKILITTAGPSRAMLRSSLPRRDRVQIEAYQSRHGGKGSVRLT